MSFSGTKRYIANPKPGVMLNPLHPLSQGLVGYWLFNEGAGSRANDISGHGNHGTLTNMSPNAQGSGWGGSKFGGGLQFDGVNDYILTDLPTNSTTNITLSAWVYIPTNSEKGVFFHNGKPVDNGDGYSLGVGATTLDNIGNNLIGAVDNIAWMNFNVPIGIGWHHVTLTRNDTTWIGYVDGIPSPTTFTNNPAVPTIGLHIGKSIDSAPRWFNGSIGPVSIYEQAKSPAEIKQLSQDPFCNLLQIPIRRYSVAAPVGAIMNQFQRANIGADLYNGAILA